MKALLSSNRYRYLRSRFFLTAVFSSVAAAFFSLLILDMVAEVAVLLPSETLALLHTGGHYNFGVLTVSDISDLTNLSLEQLMSSAFLGGYLTMILAIIIPIFICGSFKGGFIQNAFVRGHNRVSIVVSYIISSIEMLLILFVLYIVTLLISVSLFMGTTIDTAIIPGLLLMFARQLIAHIAFLTVCISTSFFLRKSSVCIVTLLFCIIMLPAVLTTADIILGFDSVLSSLWIVNIIGSWSVIPSPNLLFSGFVAVLTIIIAGGMALAFFKYSDVIS